MRWSPKSTRRRAWATRRTNEVLDLHLYRACIYGMNDESAFYIDDTIEVPSWNLVLNTRFAFVNMPSFNDTTMN